MPALYDRIGKSYDGTRRADAGIVARLTALLGHATEGRVLDLACGTGSYTAALAARGGHWTGVDASEVMLRAARARAPEIEWQHADAGSLPFPDATFDGALCTLAVHHFPGRTTAFREVRRLLDGGPFVLFVCDVERTRRFWLRAYFPRMFERIAAKEPSESAMVGELEAAGFQVIDSEPWFVPKDLTDHMLYCGKERPELYFDPAIRAGISSFADLSDEAEVESGLERLRADIESGRIAEVMASSQTPDGDYLFLRAR